MLCIQSRQFASLSEGLHRAFLRDTVVDWIAAYEVSHGKPPRIGFDEAARIASYLDNLLQSTIAPEMPEDPTRELIHRALTAGEKGATGDQLRAAVSLFAGSLPAEEAAFILFDWLCAADQG